MTITLTEEQIQTVAQAIDNYNRTQGLRVAAQCLSVMTVIQAAAQPTDDQQSEDE